MSRLLSRPDYRRFWLASTVSAFGTEVTTLALSILAVSVMRVSAPEAGLINAARWLPYLLLGVFAGLAVDRYRRRPILVGTDLGKGLVLLAIPGLYAADLLTPLSLALVVAAFGTLSLFSMPPSRRSCPASYRHASSPPPTRASIRPAPSPAPADRYWPAR